MANELINVTTNHSIGKSSINLSSLVDYAKNVQASNIIITDYDTVSEAAELISLCSNSGIKSSVGVKIKIRYKDNEGYVALIAKNYSGYIAIGRALRDASNSRDHPSIDKEVLEKYFEIGSVGRNNVILTTCGMDGLIFNMMEYEPHFVKTALEYLIEVFGNDNVYVEMQFHGYVVEKNVYPALAEIADDLNINLLATNDPVFIHVENDDAILQMLKYAKNKEVFSLSPSLRHYCIKNIEQLREALVPILYETQVDKAINNIGKLAALCDLKIPDEKHYPTYKTDDSKTTEQILRDKVNQGVLDRAVKMTEEYEQRLYHELDIIIKMGFADYILIIADLIGYIKVKGRERFGECCIIKGPGRGSAVGSLVCYLLGITDVDPIMYGLMFERFLNPARKSMPDIDIDINPAIWDIAITYLKNTYGENSFAGILSYNRYLAKSAISLAGQYLQEKHDDNNYRILSEKMSKACKSSSIIRENRNELTPFLKADPRTKEIIKTAKLVESTISSDARHPSGILISDSDDITNYVPVQYSMEKMINIAECTAEEAEKIYHLLKIDLLNVQTLDTVSSLLSLIQESANTTVDFDTIPFEASVFRNVFSNRQTEFIFQFGSLQARKILKAIKPSCISDLMFVLALDRAGSMDFINESLEYIKNKRKPDYYIPQIENITQDTYGFVIYQEQIIQIFTELAGYSIEEADVVRAAISKKKKEIISAEHDRFVCGCINNGIPEKAAEKLLDQIISFGAYFFNKSHAAAYAVLSYRIGWLLFNFPKQFLMGFQVKMQNVNTYIKYCAMNNIAILKPDINSATIGNRITHDGIMIGLSSICGVGSIGEKIETERLEKGIYQDLADFIIRISPDSEKLKNLALAGAFDGFAVNPYSIAANCERITDIGMKLKLLNDKLKTETNQSELLRIKRTFSELKAQMQRLSSEKTDTPLATIIKDEIEVMEVPSNDFRDAYDSIIKDNSDVRICNISEGNHRLCGLVLDVIEKSKESNGALYADVSFYDGTGILDCRISSYDYPNMKSAINSKKLLCITGNFQVNEYGKETFWVKKAFGLSEDL